MFSIDPVPIRERTALNVAGNSPICLAHRVRVEVGASVPQLPGDPLRLEELSSDACGMPPANGTCHLATRSRRSTRSLTLVFISLFRLR
jgi:hypothetical protein